MRDQRAPGAVRYKHRIRLSKRKLLIEPRDPVRAMRGFPIVLYYSKQGLVSGLPTDFANVRDRSYEAPEESACASLGSSRRSGQIKCAINRFHEGALFPNDDAFSFRRREVRARLRIDLQLLSVCFVPMQGYRKRLIPTPRCSSPRKAGSSPPGVHHTGG